MQAAKPGARAAIGCLVGEDRACSGNCFQGRRPAQSQPGVKPREPNQQEFQGPKARSMSSKSRVRTTPEVTERIVFPKDTGPAEWISAWLSFKRNATPFRKTP